MKKQINPSLKAHLMRGAFYLLLLLAVCAIPFALAQRNASNRTAVKPALKPNLTATGPALSRTHAVPANPDQASGIGQAQPSSVRTHGAAMPASGAVDATGAAVI